MTEVIKRTLTGALILLVIFGPGTIVYYFFGENSFLVALGLVLVLFISWLFGNTWYDIRTLEKIDHSLAVFDSKPMPTFVPIEKIFYDEKTDNIYYAQMQDGQWSLSGYGPINTNPGGLNLIDIDGATTLFYLTVDQLNEKTKDMVLL